MRIIAHMQAFVEDNHSSAPLSMQTKDVGRHASDLRLLVVLGLAWKLINAVVCMLVRYCVIFSIINQGKCCMQQKQLLQSHALQYPALHTYHCK